MKAAGRFEAWYPTGCIGEVDHPVVPALNFKGVMNMIHESDSSEL